ncbi:MAG: T9SS type A sorting domain-containing protein [Bacteroidota bacterium]
MNIKTVSASLVTLKKRFKNTFFLLLLLCTGFNFSTHAQGLNLGFELTPAGVYTNSNGVTGWTVTSQTVTSCATSTVWTAGSPEFSVVNTPILTAFPFTPFVLWAPLPASPLGGNNIARLNDATASGLSTRIRQTFTVVNTNPLFLYAFAGMWQDGGHLCCEQARLKVNVYDCSGTLLTMQSKNFSANGTSCTNGAPSFSLSYGWTWTSWQTEYIDLTPYIGSCVTIEVLNSDCIYGTHAGTTYFDASTPLPLAAIAYNGSINSGTASSVSFCQGASQAQITAPLGYTAYQWYGPNSLNQPVPIGSVNGGNTPLVTINNPTAGVVYTVQLVTSGGYTFTEQDTLQYSTVSIDNIFSNATCFGGASGSAVVHASGSGTGYNYTWVNSGNTVVSTSSLALNLALDLYSVTVSAIGSPGCGSPSGTAAVGNAAVNIYTVITPFCSTLVTLNSPPGSNRRWYNGIVSIPAAQGGTASTLSVVSPTTGQFFWLAYLTPQGCSDSVKYLLNQVTPGSMSVTNVSYACTGINNAQANLMINPASSVPPGMNSYSVFSTSGPSYSSTVTNIPVNTYTPVGLSAGNYSVIASDGVCQYTNTFVVSDYVFSYQVLGNTSTPTVCVGSTVLLGVSFSTAIVPGQYNFLWSPATDIVGGPLNALNISVMLNPSVTSTIGTNVYTVVVTPSVVNCPITKTISVTSLTLPTPVLSAMPQPFCNTASSKTVTAFPASGTFTSSSGNWINSVSGVITPSLTAAGTNTFAYNLSIGSCVSGVTGSFSVSHFNSATITTPTMSFCDNYPNCVNLLTVTQNTNGVWSGTGVSNNLFCPLNVPAGQHTFTYLNVSTPDPTLCPSSNSMTVTVRASAIQGIVTPAPFCTNALPFTLTITTTGGAWQSTIPFFLSTNGMVNPVNSPGGVVTVSYTGYCGNTATVNLNTAIYHSAALTGSLNGLCLNGSPVDLMSVAASSVNGSWSGSGVANNFFTPAVPLGAYTLTYNTTSSNPPLCPGLSTLAITVYSVPVLTIQADTTICEGETIALTASGATSYSLNGVYTFPVVLVTPTVTSTYTMSGESNNCTGFKTIIIEVSECTGIDEIAGKDLLNIYPNPTNGNLFIELATDTKIILFDALGRKVFEDALKSGKHRIELHGYGEGMYFLSCIQANKTKVTKIILEH